VTAHVRHGDVFGDVDELAALEPQARHQLAATLRQVSETLVAVVPDGQKASYVLGVLAQLLDPERSTC
jgi:hypothetical protein